MSAHVIVIVSDLDDAKHGEINMVESIPQALTLIETLLGAGFDQTRIRVFEGAEMDMRVRERPLVTLVADGTGELPPGADEGVDESAVRFTARAATHKEEIAVEPYTKDGMRFRAAFRPG
jgi:hypothetical protein